MAKNKCWGRKRNWDLFDELIYYLLARIKAMQKKTKINLDDEINLFSKWNDETIFDRMGS